MPKDIISKKFDVLDSNWSSRAHGYQNLAKRILKEYSKHKEEMDSESNLAYGCDWIDSEYGSSILELSYGCDSNRPEHKCVKEGGSASYNGEQFCIRRN